ncbi:hypothetical protein [Streptomyces sp. NBC_00289]|uniref:hypothetical protein n=1 Tax=Streptomyces sp. NBC_00289 TaxID=2975703 RepID=UPI002F919F41
MALAWSSRTPSAPTATAGLDTATVDADQNLDAACATVAGVSARTDGKASLLLAFNGAVLAGLASVADPHLPPLPGP